MIPFKVKIKRFKKVQIFLPTEWGELTLNQFFKIQQAKEPQRMFQILTGFDGKIKIESFLPYMDWVATPIELENFKDETIQVDIFSLSYANRIRIEQILNKGELLNYVHSLCAIFSHNENYYLNQKLSNLLPFCLAIIDAFNQVCEKEASLLNRKPTFEEQAAGIDKFKELSHFNTIDMLAKEYGYTHDDVEKLEYNIIFLILRRKQLISNFENKHREILKQGK